MAVRRTAARRARSSLPLFSQIESPIFPELVYHGLRAIVWAGSSNRYTIAQIADVWDGIPGLSEEGKESGGSGLRRHLVLSENK